VLDLIQCPRCFALRTKQGDHNTCPLELVDLPRFFSADPHTFGWLLVTKLQKPAQLEDEYRRDILEKVESLHRSVAAVVMNDPVILALGWFIYKTETSDEKLRDIPKQMLTVGRLVVKLRKAAGNTSQLAEFLEPRHLEVLITASGLDGEMHDGMCPRLLLMCIQILRGHAVRHKHLRKNQVLCDTVNRKMMTTYLVQLNKSFCRGHP
jgi:hypothetical protein